MRSDGCRARITGLRVRFSVHDELVVSCKRCQRPRRDDPQPNASPIEALHEPNCPWIEARMIVRKEMSRVPACFPALKGLPVACELSDGIRECYGK